MSPPCSDHQPSPSEERAANECRELRVKVDELTDMLCRIGRAMLAGRPTEMPKDILEWMAEHAAADARRGKPW